MKAPPTSVSRATATPRRTTLPTSTVERSVALVSFAPDGVIGAVIIVRLPQWARRTGGRTRSRRHLGRISDNEQSGFDGSPHGGGVSAKYCQRAILQKHRWARVGGRPILMVGISFAFSASYAELREILRRDATSLRVLTLPSSGVGFWCLLSTSLRFIACGALPGF